MVHVAPDGCIGVYIYTSPIVAHFTGLDWKEWCINVMMCCVYASAGNLACLEAARIRFADVNSSLGGKSMYTAGAWQLRCHTTR